MKKILLIGGVVAALVVIGVVVFLFSSLNSIVKSGVETVGPKLTGTTLTLEKVDLSPFSGSGQVTGLVIGNPEGYKTPFSIKVGDAKLALNVKSVFGNTIEVSEINIQGPEITFEGGLRGNNLSKILANIEAAAGGKSADTKKTEPSSGPEKRFRVKEVHLAGGKIHANLTDLGAKTLTIPLPELRMQNIGTTGDGVTAGELTEQIIKTLLASVTKAVIENSGDISKAATDAAKGAKESIDKTVKDAKGLKDLFKK
jgi:uncharacterized protein involved in outer membrane biogenesis